MAEKNQTLRLRCRIQYPQLAAPRAFQDGQTPKFSLVAMVPKDGSLKTKFRGETMEAMAALNLMVDEELENYKPGKVAECRRYLGANENRFFIRDGDKKLDKDGNLTESAGHWLLTLKNAKPPVLVDRFREPLDPEFRDLVGGCWGNVIFWPYVSKANPPYGVYGSLGGFQFIKLEEAFGGRRINAATDFEDLGDGDFDEDTDF